MKRLLKIAMACLAIAAVLSVPAFAFASEPPLPVSDLEVHFVSQNATVTLPVPNPDHPDHFAPDVTFTISWKTPQDSQNDTIEVAATTVPWVWTHPELFEWDNFAKVEFHHEPINSITVTMTPVLTHGADYGWSASVWRQNDTTISAPAYVLDALVTSTPSPVFNPRVANGQLSWDRFLPVYWNGSTWVNFLANGQGSPVGTLNVQVTQDGVQIVSASIEGTSDSWPIPILPAGHNYSFAISRSFEGKTSPAAQTSLAIPAPPFTTTTSLTGPGSVKHNKWFTLTGRVSPQGSGKLRIQSWQLKKHRWVSQGSRYTNLASNAWHLSTRLKTKGNWRFRAFYSGSGGVKPTLASTSDYRAVKVK